MRFPIKTLLERNTTSHNQYSSPSTAPLPWCGFANDCQLAMHPLLKQLATTLGTETLNLGMRFGCHSGPITAGVLRGEKSRFQLFDDTMNTTARIESSGETNRIHISEDTVALLVAGGWRKTALAQSSLRQSFG